MEQQKVGGRIKKTFPKEAAEGSICILPQTETMDTARHTTDQSNCASKKRICILPHAATTDTPRHTTDQSNCASEKCICILPQTEITGTALAYRELKQFRVRKTEMP